MLGSAEWQRVIVGNWAMDKQKKRNRPGAAEEVQAILCCPSCRGSVVSAGGGMHCTTCSRPFPLVNGVVRFVDAQHYAGSFGFQWLRHHRTQLDTDETR